MVLAQLAQALVYVLVYLPVKIADLATHAAELILKNHRAKECDDVCMPIKDIIRLIPAEV